MSAPNMYQPGNRYLVIPHRHQGRHQSHFIAKKDEGIQIKKSCSIHCYVNLALRSHSLEIKELEFKLKVLIANFTFQLGNGAFKWCLYVSHLTCTLLLNLFFYHINQTLLSFKTFNWQQLCPVITFLDIWAQHFSPSLIILSPSCLLPFRGPCLPLLLTFLLSLLF